MSVNHIGQTSEPPKFSVVDTSQEYLSLCLCKMAPLLYILAYDYVGYKSNLVSFDNLGVRISNIVSITKSP